MGFLVLSDLLGNVKKVNQRHKAKINSISVEEKEEYIATASDDGIFQFQSIRSSYCYIFEQRFSIYFKLFQTNKNGFP